jgi:hypothetical protein
MANHGVVIEPLCSGLVADHATDDWGERWVSADGVPHPAVRIWSCLLVVVRKYAQAQRPDRLSSHKSIGTTTPSLGRMAVHRLITRCERRAQTPRLVSGLVASVA